MAQGTLHLELAGRAKARYADPLTSHLAAAEVEATGAADTQRARCLGLVRAYPGSTAAELAETVSEQVLAEWGTTATKFRYTVSRRLSELWQRGLVRRGERRPCEVGGRLSMTWYPA